MLIASSLVSFVKNNQREMWDIEDALLLEVVS
jgi:hypothetical protein